MHAREEKLPSLRTSSLPLKVPTVELVVAVAPPILAAAEELKERETRRGRRRLPPSLLSHHWRGWVHPRRHHQAARHRCRRDLHSVFAATRYCLCLSLVSIQSSLESSVAGKTLLELLQCEGLL
ncbi:uncharacterized protein LOC127744817 [Arachis duranensis]|uniref:Uncharacterized protein LOC127744817 n=1 Tax=Arachis duranensis TaxID=130453 RepID=A0A9C6TMI2_ARADU|nr:uncharacterized protein LOC127744817 [Arachis duranensis]